MREIINNYIKMVFILIISIMIGTTAMCIINIMPNDLIEKNVAESAWQIKDEGKYPKIGGWYTSIINNWTDARILNEATYMGEESTLDRALLVYNQQIDDTNPYESLIRHFVLNEKYTNTDYYARYWHGYLIIWKMLLCVMSLKQIRLFNLILQMLLNGYIVYLMNKNGMRKYIIPYILSYLLIGPLMVSFSLSFANTYYIVLIATVVFLKNAAKKDNKRMIYFFIVGECTSFFASFSFPIVTLGIPLIMYLCEVENDSVYQLKKIFYYIVSWMFGFLGMWVGKWIVASVFTSENIVEDALKAFLQRTSHVSDAGEKISVIEALFRNVGYYALNPIMIIAVIVSLYLFIQLIVKMYKRKKTIKSIKIEILTFGIIILLPFIWYIMTTNHCYVHCWFTCKNLTLTLLGGLCLLTKCNMKIEEVYDK